MMKAGVKRLLFGALGAGAGFAYYTYIGCATGACPITSNPYITTAYGALVGVLLGEAAKPQPPRDNG